MSTATKKKAPSKAPSKKETLFKKGDVIWNKDTKVVYQVAYVNTKHYGLKSFRRDRVYKGSIGTTEASYEKAPANIIKMAKEGKLPTKRRRKRKPIATRGGKGGISHERAEAIVSAVKKSNPRIARRIANSFGDAYANALVNGENTNNLRPKFSASESALLVDLLCRG